jgi:hypothetical protein
VIERLIECATCARHVKSCDAACPFCHAPMRAAPATTRAPYGRLAAGAAVATVVACTTYVQAPTVVRGLEPGASLPPSDGGFFVPPPSGVVFYGSPGIEPTPPPGLYIGPTPDADDEDADDAALTDAANADAADDVALTDAATDSEAVDAPATDGD